jgi:hypothetical protein
VSNCRSGCPSQDHASWGECARAARLQIGDLGSGVKRYTDARLNAYADARRQGLQPEGTHLSQVRAAIEAADA